MHPRRRDDESSLHCGHALSQPRPRRAFARLRERRGDKFTLDERQRTAERVVKHGVRIVTEQMVHRRQQVFRA
jgi:hypothetical protein